MEVEPFVGQRLEPAAGLPIGGIDPIGLVHQQIERERIAFVKTPPALRTAPISPILSAGRAHLSSFDRLSRLVVSALAVVLPASGQAQGVVAPGISALQSLGADNDDRFDRDGGTGAKAVEGTWIVTIVPPIPGAPSHKAYISFLRGGVVVAGPDPFLPPFVAPIVRMATAQGTWETTRHKEFAWTFIAVGSDVSGAPVGFIKFSGRARLTGKDSFEGAAKVARCELNVTTCGPYSAAAGNFGARLPLETP